MRIALYARVSTSRQAQAQTIEQQLARLQAHVQARGETLAEQAVFCDAGYRGASLSRAGLDQLRDRAALAEFDRVVVTAPDRLARKYVPQVRAPSTCAKSYLLRNCTGTAAPSSLWSGPCVRIHTTSCCCRFGGRSPNMSAR